MMRANGVFERFFVAFCAPEVLPTLRHRSRISPKSLKESALQVKIAFIDAYSLCATSSSGALFSYSF
jgi:methyl coenzyme M reductase alpha subunit